MKNLKSDPRFAGIEPFIHKLWLSSPTMHGDEEKYVTEAIRTNWVSTIGENIDKIEEEIAALIGVKHAVALSSGTSALHLGIRLAAEKLYGQATLPETALMLEQTFSGAVCACRQITK